MSDPHPFPMKKLFALMALATLLNGCSKDSPSVPDPNNAPAVSAVPDHFDQKIIIENFTMTTCGQCPLANIYLDSLIRFNPERIYSVSMHIDDIMADTSLNQSFSGLNYYDSLFNPLHLYPSGTVNRRINSLSDLSPDQWAIKTFTTLSQVPACGIALEAELLQGNSIQLNVHVGFADNLYGQYRIHAYVVQNEVVSGDSIYDQLNDFSSEGVTPDSTFALYWMNDTIHLYRHKNVFKRNVTPEGVEGRIIPEALMTKGNSYVTSFAIDLTGINTDNSYIIVFVDKHATTMGGHWIENVQKVNFFESKDWN